MAGKSPKKTHLTEPTWFASEDGGPPLTELLAENQGSLSPFGEDVTFPLPVNSLHYTHPTDRPNRAAKNS